MRTAQDHDHLSYSQINSYLSCSLKYKFQYVDRIPPAFTATFLAFGSAIHEAAAAFYQTRLEGEELRPDQMLDVYRDSWRQAGKVKFFNGDNEEKLAKKAEELLHVFHANSDPSIQVVGVEEFFEVPFRVRRVVSSPIKIRSFSNVCQWVSSAKKAPTSKVPVAMSILHE